MALGHADKWGPLGSIFASLCCLGLTPLVGTLAALGLGFLINDLILIPMLVVFLGISIWAFDRDRHRHLHWGPEAISVFAAALTLVGILLFFPSLVIMMLAFLVGASIWNLILVRRCARS